MKKIHALLFLGAFLLVAGLGARYYAYPRLAVIPADLDSKVVAENPPGEPATYFSIAELSEVSGELGNQTQARVDPVATEELAAELDRDVLVVRTYACTDDIAVDCSTIRYPLSAALSTFAVDRRTGEPVEWDDASIETGGSVEPGVEFEGLTIKFPFNAQQQTYGFWNADLRTSIPVEFVGETERRRARRLRVPQRGRAHRPRPARHPRQHHRHGRRADRHRRPGQLQRDHLRRRARERRHHLRHLRPGQLRRPRR